MARSTLGLLCALLLGCTEGLARPPWPHGARVSHPNGNSRLRAAGPQMREYSTKVKMTAETRAPFRQARMFFLFPSIIAGASIGAYVTITRLAAGLGGFRDDVVPLDDAGNLLVNIAVVASAVWALSRDRRAASELLEQVAEELEGPAPAEALADTDVR